MGESIKKTGNEVVERWHQKMPRFFYWIVVIVCSIIATAFAIHSGVPAMGGTLPEWFTEIYSHILTCGIGIICVCKLTVAGGYKKIDPDKVLRGNHIVDHSATAVNESDIEPLSAGDM